LKRLKIFLFFALLFDSRSSVTQQQIICKRDSLLERLPNARDILRGSLLDRTIRHSKGCKRCEAGGGHAVSVLAIGYPGGRMHQISLLKEQAAHGKQCLENYYKLKAALEEICELNQQLLPWMRQADKVLEDEQLLTAVYEALVRRHPKSRTRRGRLGTPAEIVLRMLLLKHIRNRSFNVVEREVRANLIYREFTRVGGGKALGRQARALGPDVIKQLHQRMVELAVGNKVVQGRKMRVDTTVVETNIHYPTDSTLLGDGTRVLTGLIEKGHGDCRQGWNETARSHAECGPPRHGNRPRGASQRRQRQGEAAADLP
jgi:hypothetical protein